MAQAALSGSWTATTPPGRASGVISATTSQEWWTFGSSVRSCTRSKESAGRPTLAGRRARS